MPIARRSATYKCNTCSWKATVVNGSDVMMEGVNVFAFCPKCKCVRITVMLASRKERLMEELKNIFR